MTHRSRQHAEHAAGVSGETSPAGRLPWRGQAESSPVGEPVQAIAGGVGTCLDNLLECLRLRNPQKPQGNEGFRRQGYAVGGDSTRRGPASGSPGHSPPTQGKANSTSTNGAPHARLQGLHVCKPAGRGRPPNWRK